MGNYRYKVGSHSILLTAALPVVRSIKNVRRAAKRQKIILQSGAALIEETKGAGFGSNYNRETKPMLG